MEPYISPADKPNDPGYQKDVYHITDGQVLAIGGDAFGRNGIDGAVDNVMVWDGAITAEDVKKSMGDINAKVSCQREGILELRTERRRRQLVQGCRFTQREQLQVPTSILPATLKVGAISYGKHRSTHQGCPFLADNAYKVETSPTWKANHGSINESTGNGSAGSAKVSYAKGGDYTVTLKLANSLGSAQRTFSVIKVSASGIDAAEAGEIKTYTVGEKCSGGIRRAGSYEVGVYDTAGVMQARKAATLNAGNVMNIHPRQGRNICAHSEEGRQTRAYCETCEKVILFN